MYMKAGAKWGLQFFFYIKLGPLINYAGDNNILQSDFIQVSFFKRNKNKTTLTPQNATKFITCYKICSIPFLLV